MSLHGDLLNQAEHLVRKEPRRPRQASLRRAVSTAYYALFHFLIDEASTSLIRGSHQGLKQLISRAFQHSEMKNASRAFAAATLRDSIADRIGSPAVPGGLRRVAQSFLDLQEARHEADYDLSRIFTKRAAEDLVEVARRAIEDWKQVRKEPAARAFLVCLLSFNRLNRR